LLDRIRENLATLEPLPAATSSTPAPKAQVRRRTSSTRLRRERSNTQP
jgi:hypothetical protein